MMHYLPYDQFSNCSSIIRNLVYDHGEDLSANTDTKVSAVEAEAKAAAACSRHSEAERRRRKRINGHLATLRSLLPNTVKADKASLLAEVVRRVKELKEMTAELESTVMNQGDDEHAIRKYEYYMIPSENDELELTYIGEDSSTQKIMIKVSICCEDRPELIAELTRALDSVRGKLVRTEIGTMGGRVKCVLWVQVCAVTKDQGLYEVRRALKAVTDRGSILDLPRNKRPRFLNCG